MKKRDLLDKVLEKSLKKDENQEEIFNKIMLKIENKEDAQIVRKKFSKSIFYKRSTAFATLIIFTIIAIIAQQLLFKNKVVSDGDVDPPYYNDVDPSYYNSADLERISVDPSYDLTGIYDKSTELDGFKKYSVFLYQTKDEEKKIVSFEIVYVGDDELSSVTLYIFLVENFINENEGKYALFEQSEKFIILVDNINYEIKFNESASPYDPEIPEIESVKQYTKFKISNYTYYVEVNYVRIIEEGREPLNMIKEAITNLFAT